MSVHGWGIGSSPHATANPNVVTTMSAPNVTRLPNIEESLALPLAAQRMSVSVVVMTKPLFRVGFASIALVALAMACGGGTKEPSAPATAGSPGASGGDPSGAAGAKAATDSSGSTPNGADPNVGGTGTNTTTQLGSGGDLQGAKLGSSVHTTTETKGDAGPKSTGGQSSNEQGRSPKDIQTVIAARRDDARACYDKALSAHPGIEGDLDVKWVIDPQGNVTDASVDTAKSTILEPSVGACIVDIIKKIKFAPSGKGYETRAHYPFNFHPKTYSAKDAGK